MTATQSNQYIGRFAPSPTGPLHLGSMFAALASYLQAKSHNGQWLVRIEDLDPPREVKGASDDILRTLEAYHLYWDNQVVYQSQRHELYRHSIDELTRLQMIYPCTCSRKTIQEKAKFGPLGMIYPGNCRKNKLPEHSPHSLRLILPDETLSFTDKIQGNLSLNLLKEIGDTVLFRADGFYAYHLAVVIDDHEQQVTEIVRGKDLLYSTPVHIHLQQVLGYSTPFYAHLPIITNQLGEKLSKQTGATRVDTDNPQATTLNLLKLLNQNPPPELKSATQQEIIAWAILHWQISDTSSNDHIINEI